MKMEQVSDNCFAVLNEKNRLCDSNSGLINLGGGVVIDTQSDLPHARQMIEHFGKVWKAMPARVVNTHEDGDHVWGNQLFEGAEIIAHRSVPERMKEVADPDDIRKLLGGVKSPLVRTLLRFLHPGLVAAGLQLLDDYDLDGVELVFPSTVFEERHALQLDGVDVHLIHVGPSHRFGDTIVHLPSERVVFAGDVVFRGCVPIGWVGTYENWFRCLDLIIELDPAVVVPGHGPMCGVDGVREMKAYLEHVRTESQDFYNKGVPPIDAAKRIDNGPYAGCNCQARTYINVERAYREFRNEPPDAPWELPKVLDAFYKIAKATGTRIEF